MMFTTRLGTHLRSKRLDAGYYAPYHLADVEVLGGWDCTPLEALRDTNSPIAYGVLKPDDQGYQCRVAKFENFKGMFVRAADCDPISEQMFAEFRRSQAVAGDILIAIGGYVGRPAIVQSIDNALRLNINRHLARFRPDSQKIDPYFALAYMSSQIGERQLIREVTGSVQAGINLQDLRLVRIPTPGQKVQQYIGDKVRQAERFGNKSQKCIERARSSVEALIATNAGGSTSHTGQDVKHQRVLSAMLADRIDGWYYKPEFLRIEAALNTVRDRGSELIPLHRIGDVEYGFMPTEDYWSRAEGAALLRVTNIKEHLVVDTSDLEYVNPVLSNKPRYHLRPGDVLCVQCGNSTGRIAYMTDKFRDMVFPSFCLRVTNVKGDWDSAFLAGFLASTVGQAQIQRTISITSVRPNTTKPAIEAVEVPKFPHNVQKSIGDVIRRGVTLREFVDPLCNAAKFLVEALIEKKITERELEAAQQALESGDLSLDREIQKRLTVAGLDVADEPPLFSDLDALYAAITEVIQSISKDGDTA
jgi:type I restriction enzyme, S subunit